MKTININFEKMYGGFLKEDNLITNTLRLRYNVVIDESNPDVIFCQDFPGDPAAPVTASRLGRSKIVHWFIESLDKTGMPNYDHCDFSISSCKFDHPQNIRIPLWALYIDWFGRPYNPNRNQAFLVSPEKLVEPKTYQPKEKFCSILTNNGQGLRGSIYPYFIQYFIDKGLLVESRGNYLRNMESIQVGAGGDEKVKLEYIKNFKFHLCFDNSQFDGWITEKLIHPLYEGVVPIYWGCPDVIEEFNNDAFIHVRDFSNAEEVCDKVLEIYRNPDMFKDIQSQPTFPGNKIPEHVKPESILEDLTRIIES